jgi:hypothetical protein
MGESTSTYPLSIALTDLEDYYRAGTFTEGLIQTSSTVGSGAATAQSIKNGFTNLSEGAKMSLHHVFGDARLLDLKPELEQFAVDAWRPPMRIFDADPPDQYAQFGVDLRSAS